MKLCVFSDIHGNGVAFKAAEKMLLNEAADMNLFLGDLCGYYHDQIEIFDRLRTFPNLFAVLGNHDQIFLDIKKGNAELAAEYLSKYGRSMELLLERENCQMADWLRALPKMLRIPKLGCLVCHGSPDDPLNGYIYPDTDIAFALPEASLVMNAIDQGQFSVAFKIVIFPVTVINITRRKL